MIKRLLASALAILVAWMILDLFLHRYFLAAMYEENAALWRPFNQMNVALIYIVTFLLIAVFLATYLLLIRPKSLRAGLAFGALIGFALGVSAGFGTYIHMPIPLALAWGWFIGGWLKAIVAGAIVGRLITESQLATG
jgi:hypothetical protein